VEQIREQLEAQAEREEAVQFPLDLELVVQVALEVQAHLMPEVWEVQAGLVVQEVQLQLAAVQMVGVDSVVFQLPLQALEELEAKLEMGALERLEGRVVWGVNEVAGQLVDSVVSRVLV